VLTVEEAVEQILSRVEPLPTEWVDLEAALGRVLGEPVVSGRQVPPWPNSSMDGYALRSEDARAANASLRVVLQVAAGAVPSRAIGPGEAARIFTGAPVPPGADAVIPQEDVRVDGDCIVAALAVEEWQRTQYLLVSVYTVAW